MLVAIVTASLSSVRTGIGSIGAPAVHRTPLSTTDRVQRPARRPAQRPAHGKRPASFSDRNERPATGGPRSISAGAAGVFSFAPSDDAFVTASQPKTNFGSRLRLRTHAAPTYQSFLKVKVSGLTAPVVSARLSLYVMRAGSAELIAHAVKDSTWDEGSITFDSAPAVGRAGRSSGQLTTGAWASIDLTSIVRGNGTFSIALTPPDGSTREAGWGMLDSRESDHAPRLTVQTGVSSYDIRGVYSRDSSPTGYDLETAAGFNMIDSGPYREGLDELKAAGLKGFVWLGDYDNDTCRFENSDDWIRKYVSAVAGHPAIAMYYIADEPSAVKCPKAPAQIKARSALVKSIDPTPPTFVVVQDWDGKHEYPYGDFAGTTDVMGLDIYPCTYAHGCDYSKIDDGTRVADRLGIRYWGVIQAHGDGYYRQPTAAELHEEFDHWRATNMKGYLVFSWKWPPDDPGGWLENHPELLAQLAVENAT